MIEWLILGAAGVGAGVYLVRRHNAKVAAEEARQEQEFREMLKRADKNTPTPAANSYAPRKSTYVPPVTKPKPEPAKTTSRDSDSGIGEIISFAAGAAISSWSDSSSSSSSSSSDSSSYSSGGGDSGGGGSSSDF